MKDPYDHRDSEVKFDVDHYAFITYDLLGYLLMVRHFDRIYGLCWRCEGMGV